MSDSSVLLLVLAALNVAAAGFFRELFGRVRK
jgi:hypothetical protein